jgi:biotin carboxyl carrier protein
MDIPIKKRHPLVKYRYYIFGGILFLVFVIYVIVAGTGPRRIRYGAENLEIAEVKQGKFLEYVDVEGIVQPLMTIKLNSLENGTVERIVAEEGSLLRQGDTILILTNPDLIRSIEDERDELEKQRITYEEKKLEMERKSSQLKRLAMETTYRLDRLSKQYHLDQEEFQIGIKSKAQLEVASDEYKFNLKNTEMLLAELQHDSLMSNIQIELMKSDFMNKEKRFVRSKKRLDDLVVKAPFSGLLSFLNVIWGERVAAGSSIGMLKIIDQFKINTIFDILTYTFFCRCLQKELYLQLKKKKIMTVVNCKEFSANQKKFFNLALNEQVVIKRGKNIFYLTCNNTINDDIDYDYADLMEAKAYINDENTSLEDFKKYVKEMTK